jgi:hypothetical protein
MLKDKNESKMSESERKKKNIIPYGHTLIRCFSSKPMKSEGSGIAHSN